MSRVMQVWPVVDVLVRREGRLPFIKDALTVQNGGAEAA